VKLCEGASLKVPFEYELPQPFIVKMQQMLGEEAEAFLAAYSQPRTAGLRLNPQKAAQAGDAAELLRRLPAEWSLTPVLWCPNGCYYDADARPGKHPLHAAGVYYIQEPSAMSAVEWLDPQPGEVVLDLAAAPGGKATQIAGKLGDGGLLVANEIHPARAKILSENIERMGIARAVVTNETPQRLAERFPSFFDRIMVDAPCSGEGMFRKDPEARGEWSLEQVGVCAARQQEILEYAVKMLKPGGVMAYSTCTFSVEENEGVVQRFLARHPHMSQMRSERIWPHRQRGEGHFVAVLCSGGGAAARASSVAGATELAAPLRSHAARERTRRGPRPPQAPPALAAAAQRWRELALELLPRFALGAGEPLFFGEQLYWLPHADGCPLNSASLRGLKVARPGLHLGTLRKDRLTPSHALALAANAEQASRLFPLRADEPAAAAYLRGEALPADSAAKGWALVTFDGFPAGWGKASGGQLKNHYPKGLRRPDGQAYIADESD
jgi:16S rRNA C967 or C1407 C5-methylase (RsmB/RsmF family)/NOL1/NOP2/fmu family ribosome biogenesis protein